MNFYDIVLALEPELLVILLVDIIVHYKNGFESSRVQSPLKTNDWKRTD